MGAPRDGTLLLKNWSVSLPGLYTRYMPVFEAIGFSIEAPISTHFGLQVYKEVSLLREYVPKVSVAEFLQNLPFCMRERVAYGFTYQ